MRYYNLDIKQEDNFKLRKLFRKLSTYLYLSLVITYKSKEVIANF